MFLIHIQLFQKLTQQVFPFQILQIAQLDNHIFSNINLIKFKFNVLQEILIYKMKMDILFLP
jgi:hypothetical protein